MSPDASHIVQPVYNDGQNAVGAATALIHFGLSYRSVALADVHDIQHILGASYLDLRSANKLESRRRC